MAKTLISQNGGGNKFLTSLTCSSDPSRCSYAGEVLITDTGLEESETSSCTMIKVQKSPLKIVLHLPKIPYCGQRII